MKFNFETLIQRDLIIINQVLIQAGLNQEDETYYTFKVEDKFRWSLMVYPRLLTYDYVYKEGSNDTALSEEVSTLWIACCCEFLTTDIESITPQLEEFIKILPLRPFYDEDAYHKYFSKQEKHEWTRLIFYLNPDYINGWWQNHALP